MVPRPPFDVQADIYRQSAGTEHLLGERFQVLAGVPITAQVGPQTLGVQGPAFSVRIVHSEPPELRQIPLPKRNRELEMMAGHGLVDEDGFGNGHRRLLNPSGVHVEDRGA